MIEKITDQNLERYDSRLKEWCDRKFFEKGNYGKYETTEEAGAVAFYPAPNTPLEGKVKFSFKETMPVEGTKGPDNPSIIEGVNQVNIVRYATNLFNGKNITGFAGENVALSISEDGIITLNGTNTRVSGIGGIYFPFSPVKLMKFNSGSLKLQAEYISGSFTNGGLDTKAWGFQQSLIRQSNDTTLAYCNITDTAPNLQYNYNFTVPVYLNAQYLYTTAGSSFNNFKFRIMVEVSDTYSNIESAAFDNYSINFDSTYYGGEIDLATGVMTVTHVCVELKGTETWENITGYNSSTGFGYSRCYPENISGKKSSIDFPNFSDPSLTYKFYSCSHFPVIRMFSDIPIQNGTLTTPCMWYTAGTDTQNGQARFAVPFSNVADLKAWLAAQKTAGTPVMLTYKIYEPFTVQLSPTEILSLIQSDKYTPKLNTVYTDADSIQISYLKSPIRDEYEKTQAILSLGGNS